MHPRVSIIDLPLIVCLLLSTAIHAAMLYSHGIHTPAEPRFESGRTVMKRLFQTGSALTRTRDCTAGCCAIAARAVVGNAIRGCA